MDLLTFIVVLVIGVMIGLWVGAMENIDQVKRATTIANNAIKNAQDSLNVAELTHDTNVIALAYIKEVNALLDAHGIPRPGPKGASDD